MDSVKLGQLRTRLRARYEWNRLTRALLGFAPAGAVVAVAAMLGKRQESALLFGSLMFLSGVLLLWYGRDLRRAVLPGLCAGLAPLTLALCANSYGHVCMDGSCTTLCLPACTLGGLVSGLAIAAVGRRGHHRSGFWISASSIALLTGAMGCTCIGFSGVIGLTLGYGAGLVPAFAVGIFGRGR